MEAKRIEISALLRAGHKPTDVAKQLNVSRMTVYRVAQRIKNSEPLHDRPRSGRPQTISRETIKKAFENDPHLKMRALARKKKISASSVSKLVKNMGGKSLRRSKKPLLSETVIQKRLERSTRLLNDMKSHGKRIVIFSDDTFSDRDFDIFSDDSFADYPIQRPTDSPTVLFSNIHIQLSTYSAI